jgi:hypothetical protein
VPPSAGGTGKEENLFWCARYKELVSFPGQGYYLFDIRLPSCRTILLAQSYLQFVIGLPVLCVMSIASDISYGLHNILRVCSVLS